MIKMLSGNKNIYIFPDFSCTHGRLWALCSWQYDGKLGVEQNISRHFRHTVSLMTVKEIRLLLSCAACSDSVHVGVWVFLSAFLKKKQVSVTMKSNLTQVNKLEQNLYKLLNLRTIMESKRMSVNFSVYKIKFRSTSINCENYLTYVLQLLSWVWIWQE